MTAYVLQPAHVPLNVHPGRGEWVEVLVGAPLQEDPKVGLGVLSGLAAVAAQVRGRCRVYELVGTSGVGIGSRKYSHASPCVTGVDEHQRPDAA